jgi:hypothetical protein
MIFFFLSHFFFGAEVSAAFSAAAGAAAPSAGVVGVVGSVSPIISPFLFFKWIL